MNNSEILKRVLNEIADSLRLDSECLKHGQATPKKYSNILIDSGHPSSGTALSSKLPSLAGSYKENSFAISFLPGSEMTIAANCSSICRFMIMRNSFMARMNFLLGRKIPFGTVGFSPGKPDDEYVARVTGGCRLGPFLHRSDVMHTLEGMKPFFKVRGDSGTLSVFSDFAADALRSGPLLLKLQKTMEFADMLGEAFSEPVNKDDSNRDEDI